MRIAVARESVSPDMVARDAAYRSRAYNIQENLVVGRHLLLGYLRMAETWEHLMIGGVGHAKSHMHATWGKVLYRLPFIGVIRELLWVLVMGESVTSCGSRLVA